MSNTSKILLIGIVVMLLCLRSVNNNATASTSSFATKSQCAGSSSGGAAASAGGHSHNNNTSSFDVIILARNGVQPLQRLVRSLDGADYGDRRVKLTIIVAPTTIGPDDEEATRDWARRLATATSTSNSSDAPAHDKIALQPSFASVDVKTYAGNDDDGRWWLQMWKPSHDDDDEGAIILNDDVVVSPRWHEWIRTMSELYGEVDDIAGFGLERPASTTARGGDDSQQRTDEPPHLHHIPSPFLSAAVGSSAFAPRASVWRDFVEWASCSLCSKANGVDGNWGRAFSTFATHHDLYCLYQSPASEPMAATHEQNATGGGAESRSTKKKDGVAASCNPRDPSLLRRFDAGMGVAAPPKDWNFVVITSAVGEYREPGQFAHFMGSLRRYYRGPVKMLIGDRSPDTLKEHLRLRGVEFETTDEGRSSAEFNVFRFQFYGRSCSPGFDWCLALDFRDVKFQSNPFPTNVFRRGPDDDVDLLVFAHRNRLQKNAPGGRWFHKNLAQCSSFRGVDLPPKKSPLVNAGGFYATPNGMHAVSSHIARHYDCNDQVTFNMGIHLALNVTRNATERPLKYTLFEQGLGPINNVAFKSHYTLDSLGRVGGSDCYLSPVVHQFDRLYQSYRSNPNCNLTLPFKYS